ncbi:hypothetical protein BLA29_004410, partial [Euroglyphus maynei]
KLIQIESRILFPTTTSSFTRFVTGTTLPSPYPIQCKSKQVYYMHCSDIKCGINHIPNDSLIFYNEDVIGTNANNGNDDGNGKKSYPGYWPWYAKININGHYYCDGTLISLDTILTQTTCFNGHIDTKSMISNNNNNITIILGSVRLSKDNIDAMEYRVGSIQQQLLMNNSNEQRLTLLKLEQHIIMDRLNIIRPICPPPPPKQSSSSSLSSLTGLADKCVIVNLNYEQDMLNHRPVKIVNMEQCRRYLTFTYQNNNNNNDHHYQVRRNESIQQQLSNHSQHTSAISMNLLKELDYNDKLCVKFRRKKRQKQSSSMNGDYHLNGDMPMNEQQQQQQNQHHGRHLYCLAKHQWNLLAFEYHTLIRSSSSSPMNEDNDENFILFQTIPFIRLV